MTETNLTRFRVTYQEEAVEQPLSLGDGDTIFNDIQLSSEPQCLALNVTSEQYKLLLSAAINGANRHFPENWIEIIYPLISAGKNYCGGSMTCEDVADCIETNEAVQAAIVENNNQYGQNNPDYLSPSGTESTTIINNRFPPAERDLPAKELDSCNLDELWGGILFMVQRLDERGRDWLEQIVSKADTWQRVAEFVGTVPIVGELAENISLAFINSAEDILNLYNAYSTPEQLEEIACDLFEMVCADCRYPTYEEIGDYYASFAIQDMADWANIALRFMVDYLTGSSGLAAIVAYYSVITFQLWVMYAQATFFGLRGSKWINIWLDNGEEFANDAWEVLCDGCNQTQMLEVGQLYCTNGGQVLGSLTQVSANRWRLTMQQRAANNDNVCFVRSVDVNETFMIANGTLISGNAVSFRAACTTSGLDLGSGNFSSLYSFVMTSFAVTNPIAQSPAVIEFDVNWQ